MNSTLKLAAYHLLLLILNALSYLPISTDSLLFSIENIRVRRIPPTTWEEAQRSYIKWTKKTLPENYLDEIRSRGRRLARRIGEPGIALDIGCGSGIYNGMTYEEAGYFYMKPGVFVVGLDPLPLEGPLPNWLNSYVVGVGEYIPFRDGVFTKSVIATTLDHVRDQGQVIKETSRVTSDRLYIWTTVLPDNRRTYDHPTRVVWRSLMVLLTRYFSEIDVFYREVYPQRDVAMLEVMK